MYSATLTTPTRAPAVCGRGGHGVFLRKCAGACVQRRFFVAVVSSESDPTTQPNQLFVILCGIRLRQHVCIQRGTRYPSYRYLTMDRAFQLMESALVAEGSYIRVHPLLFSGSSHALVPDIDFLKRRQMVSRKGLCGLTLFQILTTNN